MSYGATTLSSHVNGIPRDVGDRCARVDLLANLVGIRDHILVVILRAEPAKDLA